MAAVLRAETCEAKITANAYVKIHLHGAKYGSELVSGFLIGSITQADSGAVISVEDVLPICHSNPIGPIFEVAGAMCSSLFQDKQVVGLYYSSYDGNFNNDESTPYFVDRVCDTIKENTKGVCLVLSIDNNFHITTDQGEEESDKLCLNAYMTNSNSTSSSGSGKNCASKRGRTESFCSYPLNNLQTSPSVYTPKVMNEALDSMLLNRKQYGIEDVQSHMAGTSASISINTPTQGGQGHGQGVSVMKNAYVNVDVGQLIQAK